MTILDLIIGAVVLFGGGSGYLFSVGLFKRYLDRFNATHGTKFGWEASFYWPITMFALGGYTALSMGKFFGNAIPMMTFTDNFDPAFALTGGKDPDTIEEAVPLNR